MPTIGSAIADLALGADGKIWFTDAQLDGIGRLDYNTYNLQASYLEPGTFLGLAAIANGPDGALWFTSAYGNQIGRIATSSLGLKTIPTPDSQPAGITTGPDGNIWFTEFQGNKIGRLTPTVSYTVIGVANPPGGGSVSCTSPVASGSTSTCTITANSGYDLRGASSTCGGSLSGRTFTTGAVTSNCTVTANFGRFGLTPILNLPLILRQ